jgi:hypothetical protein
MVWRLYRRLRYKRKPSYALVINEREYKLTALSFARFALSFKNQVFCFFFLAAGKSTLFKISL